MRHKLTLLALLAACAAEERVLPSRPPHPPTVTGNNPLVALSSALVSAVLYLLQLAQHAASVVTITIPT
jgi:hypothetical protein